MQEMLFRHTALHICMYIHKYMYIYEERKKTEREKAREREERVGEREWKSGGERESERK